MRSRTRRKGQTLRFSRLRAFRDLHGGLSLGACIGAWLLLGMLGWGTAPARAAVPLHTNDVVVWVGGSAVVALDQSGSLETLLLLAHPSHGLRCRSLAWEGDTVFSKPREVNFPGLNELLARTRATVVFLQFGAMESFGGPEGLPAFREAYDRLLAEVGRVVPRRILVTPPPFEAKPPPLPDMTAHANQLAAYVDAIRDLATAQRIELVDVYGALLRRPPVVPWTLDGQSLSPEGERIVAAVWLREMGAGGVADAAMEPAFWEREDVKRLRGAVESKNRLWFDYWRPTNWAFLHGDRSDQPSSRDHRDLKIRWFPDEIERFVPLLQEAELRVASLAAQTEVSR